MILTENTRIGIQIGSLLTIAGLLITCTIWVYNAARDIDETKHGVQAIRNWLWIEKNPEDDWAKDYKHNHRFLE